MEKRSYHHKDLKRELIEKGIELVNEGGVSQFSLRKAAQACNVSHAAPYSHFAGKEELLDAMQSFVTEQFSDALEKTILNDQDSPAFLLEFGRTYISFFINRPQYFTFLFQRANMQLDLNLGNEGKSNYKPFTLYKEQVLRLFENAGVPSNKQQDIMIALWAYVHGLTSLATMKNINYTEDWEAKIADLIAVFGCEI